MKKLLWIIGTVIASMVLFFAVAFIFYMFHMVKMRTTGLRQLNYTDAAATVIVIGWAILTILSIVLWRRFKFRCPTCKKWAALKLEKTDIVKQESISVIMELEDRNRNGDIIGTHDQYIPGKRKTYQNTFTCKHCGNLATSSYMKDSPSI